MAITDYTPSATGTTERDLIANSTTLTYSTTDAEAEVVISLENMAAGDQFRFRAYEKVTAGGSAQPVYEAYRDGVQSEPLKVPRLLYGHGWTVTALKITGTDRVFPLSVRTVDSVSGTVNANVVQWNGSNVVTPNTAGVPRVDVKAMEANVLTATAINADAITAAKLHSDVTTELQNGLATAAALAVVDDFLDTEIAAIKAKTDQLTFSGANVYSHLASTSINVINPTTFTPGAIDARALNTDAVEEIQSGIAAAVWGRTIESVGATDYSAEQLFRLVVSILAGDGEDLDGPNPLFKSLDGTKTRISGITDDDERNATIGDLS